MRRGLIGQNVRRDVAPQQFGKHIGNIAHQPYGQRPVVCPGIERPFEGHVEIVGHPVAVSGASPAFDSGTIHVNAQKRGFVKRRRQRLRPAHAAEPTGHDQPALQRGPKVLSSAGGERFVGALENALGADVNPASGGHLAEHRQSHRF